MKEQRWNYLTVAGLKSFNNGDGVCYNDEQDASQGFRINRGDGINSSGQVRCLYPSA